MKEEVISSKKYILSGDTTTHINYIDINTSPSPSLTSNDGSYITWGNAGGTVYELVDISNLPEMQQEVYRGILQKKAEIERQLDVLIELNNAPQPIKKGERLRLSL